MQTLKFCYRMVTQTCLQWHQVHLKARPAAAQLLTLRSGHYIIRAVVDVPGR